MKRNKMGHERDVSLVYDFLSVLAYLTILFEANNRGSVLNVQRSTFNIQPLLNLAQPWRVKVLIFLLP